MNKVLAAFIAVLQGHEALADIFLSSAAAVEYDSSLPGQDDIWRATIVDVAQCLGEFLEEYDGSEVTGAEELTVSCFPADLGSAVANKVKALDVSYDLFLELIKLLRAVFVDSLLKSTPSSEEVREFLGVVHFFFDRFEIAASITWLQQEKSLYHKKIREANYFILQEKRRYFTIFKRMVEPAFVVDEDLKLIDANPAFERFFNVRKKDQLGKSCCEVVGGQVCGVCGLEKAIREKSSFSSIEAEIVLQGDSKTVLFAGTSLGDINGAQSGGIVIIQDITEKKKYERMLRESEEQYRSLVENVPDVTWRIDSSGSFVFISSNIEKICGYSAEAILQSGQSGWFERVHPEDADTVRSEFGELFAGNKKMDVRYRLRKKDGSWIWVYDRSGSIYEKDGNQYADGVLSDITELKHVEEELERHHFRLAELVDERTVKLQRANEELQREVAERQHVEEQLMQLAARLKCSNDELEQFAHVASHDLKEPLLLIVAFCERLSRYYSDDLNERGNEYLLRITRTAKRMQQLVDDLLQLSRVSTSRQPFETIDLNDLLNEVVQHLEEHINRVGGRVEIHSPHVLDGDRLQVLQLFQNIITNALKFRKESGEPHIVITSRVINNDFCEVTVEDNGIGFDEKYLERIFNPFERLHGRNEYEGTGIGLATCKKIVIQHGGEITAKSAPGKGSTFIIRLPRSK